MKIMEPVTSSSSTLLLRPLLFLSLFVTSADGAVQTIIPSPDGDNVALLDIRPNSQASSLLDAAGIDPPAVFTFEPGFDLRRSIKNTPPAAPHELEPPIYYPDGHTKCSPPTGVDGSSVLSSWPGDGCVCFEPSSMHMSYYNMTDGTDPNNAVTGYRSAFDTSVTHDGGVTVAGWFKASDTSDAPWNARAEHPGQQTSLIFIRGEKSSWDSGYNIGLKNWAGWAFEVVLKGPIAGSRHRIVVNSPTNSYPGIDVWHYVVGTYDANDGRASLYVDNKLVAHGYAPLDDPAWIETGRPARDIKWNNDYQTSQSRFGNGYDSNDKNFHGCTGGVSVYGSAACFQVSTCAEIDELLGEFETSSLNICASSTPISCRPEGNQDTQLDFDGRKIQLKCVSNDLAQERCVMDLRPSDSYRYLSGTDIYTHSVIKLRERSSLVMEGFEMRGHQGKYSMVYALGGSSFVCRGCVFQDNQAAGGSGFGRGIIIRDNNKECNPIDKLGNIVFENCFFHQNVGELIYIENSYLTLKNSVLFQNEAMIDEKGGFISISGDAVNEFDHVISNNAFVDNDGTVGGIHSRWISRGMPEHCKVLLADWWKDDLCNKDLRTHDGNCASGNLNPGEIQGMRYDCEDGIWLKWPINRCVRFHACSSATTPSIDDIYPIPESDISPYLALKNPKFCPAPPPTSAPAPKSLTSPQGGSFGDPHVKTWDGSQFDFHGACDLVLVDSKSYANGKGLTVHIRTKIVTWWSYIDSAVIRIGEDTFEVKGGTNVAHYWINGVPGTNPLTESGELEGTVGGYPIHFKKSSVKSKKFRIMKLPGGHAIGIETFNDFVAVNIRADNNKEQLVGALGLMGEFPSGAKVARDGVTVMQNTDLFGQEWQVRAGEPKLFQNAEGAQHPESCEMPNALERKTRRLGEALLTEEEAAQACAHVSEEFQGACISDVLATNNKDMAGAY